MSQHAKEMLDLAIDRMFHDAQQALPIEQRCAHTKAAMCTSDHDGYHCTLVKGHTCSHVAHGRLGDVLRRWS